MLWIVSKKYVECWVDKGCLSLSHPIVLPEAGEGKKWLVHASSNAMSRSLGGTISPACESFSSVTSLWPHHHDLSLLPGSWLWREDSHRGIDFVHEYKYKYLSLVSGKYTGLSY